ncbi:acyl-CoA synthetase/AMP-acid ligase [Striga asiatica]|uniref:Acyl-CoA synthetase/AMP-acid ligase n=1 Tax=Striga asiatica TaxID=4170 RepID=A0A5A7R4W5_STRAF|nr:acyl-CoA synthetase/AMP-acid ligase [Striga asiatica]
MVEVRRAAICAVADLRGGVEASLVSTGCGQWLWVMLGGSGRSVGGKVGEERGGRRQGGAICVCIGYLWATDWANEVVGGEWWFGCRRTIVWTLCSGLLPAASVRRRQMEI